MDHQKRYEQLIGKIRTWAEESKEWRAAMILGSRARVEQPADGWSDLDVVIFSTNTTRYLESTDWLHGIGSFSISFIEPTAVGGGRERRVFFDDGCEVDFSFFSEKDLEVLLSNPQVKSVMRRGYRVLFDKDGLIGKLPEQEGIASLQDNRQLPTEEEFDNEVQDFWYHAILALKKIRRAEAWQAKMVVDGYLKMKLLTMIEWHAKASYGLQYDTWFSGRFLNKWADERIVEQMKEIFAHFNEKDLQRALVKTMDLYRWVAQETADKLNIEYPMKADAVATNWVADHLTAAIES